MLSYKFAQTFTLIRYSTIGDVNYCQLNIVNMFDTLFTIFYHLLNRMELSKQCKNCDELTSHSIHNINIVTTNLFKSSISLKKRVQLLLHVNALAKIWSYIPSIYIIVDNLADMCVITSAFVSFKY